MRCPYCHYLESHVVDSRLVDEGNSVRRRRRCEQCSRRFTTYEKVKEIPLMVVKKDRQRQFFDREKVFKGILKACEKRPVSMDVMDNLCDQIERECRARAEKEVQAKEIGRVVMEKLYHIDHVAYVRFASVYKEFQDIDSFAKELRVLKNPKRKRKTTR